MLIGIVCNIERLGDLGGMNFGTLRALNENTGIYKDFERKRERSNEWWGIPRLRGGLGLRRLSGRSSLEYFLFKLSILF